MTTFTVFHQFGGDPTETPLPGPSFRGAKWMGVGVSPINHPERRVLDLRYVLIFFQKVSICTCEASENRHGPQKRG